MKALASDQDSIDVLPLSIVPLQTTGLRNARIVKNSRLEGMVELFSDRESGSGQIRPGDLPTVFEFRENNAGDLDTVKRLSELSSYDVYSLRILLRHAGIQLDQHAELRLTDEARSLLEPYMRTFTRPLLKAVYGNDSSHEKDLRGLIRLFSDPDTDQALQNLARIAETLSIDLPELPQFLDDYGDVYLSLAYYQHYLEMIGPGLSSFIERTRDLRERGRNTMSRAFLQACDRIEGVMLSATIETKGILEQFQVRTVDLWDDISRERFAQVKQLITEHQAVIGGNLCVLKVKLDSWTERDRGLGLGRDETMEHFVLSEMLPGLDGIAEINAPASDADAIFV